VIVKDDVFCGRSRVFTTVINPLSSISGRKGFKETLIRGQATKGANAILLGGYTAEDIP